MRQASADPCSYNEASLIARVHGFMVISSLSLRVYIRTPPMVAGTQMCVWFFQWVPEGSKSLQWWPAGAQVIPGCVSLPMLAAWRKQVFLGGSGMPLSEAVECTYLLWESLVVLSWLMECLELIKNVDLSWKFWFGGKVRSCLVWGVVNKVD